MDCPSRAALSRLWNPFGAELRLPLKNGMHINVLLLLCLVIVTSNASLVTEGFSSLLSEGFKGRDVHVAVLDSGISLNDARFRVAEYKDWTGENTSPSSHGTFVAGVIGEFT